MKQATIPMKGMRGSLQEVQNLDNVLRGLGLVPDKDSSSEDREVATKVYRIEKTGIRYLVRIWLDARIGEGTVKIRKAREV